MTTAERHLKRFAWTSLILGGLLHEPVHAQAAPPTDVIKEIGSGAQPSEDLPLIIAHRGASGYLPEHTTESAAFAYALGADYIEQDVVLSKDGVAVVLHDVTLEAVTNVRGVFPDRIRDSHYYVFDFTLQELKSLRVTERAGKASVRFPRGRGDFQVATLTEHIELIQGLNHSSGRTVGLYVEIKKPAQHRSRGLDPSREVLRILSEYGYESEQDRAYIQCFEEAEVARLRTELKCRLPLIQLLSSPPSAQKIAQIARVADGLGVSLSCILTGKEGHPPVVSDLVRTAHENALVVHAWTHRDDQLPNYAESSTELLKWLVVDAGVSGIFTDHPDVLLSFRQSIHKSAVRQGPFHLLRGDPGRKKTEFE